MQGTTKTSTAKTAAIWAVLLIACAAFAYAAENLAGQAFSDSGNFAIGHDLILNDTDTGESYQNVTGAPLGQYTVVMQNATSGHTATVFAWNDTHVGFNNGTFTSGTLTVNVTINITWSDWNASQATNQSGNETTTQEVQTMDTGTVLFHFGSMIIALILFIASFVIVRTLFMFLAGVTLLIVAAIIWTLSGALSAVFLALGIYTFARAMFE